MTIKGLASLYFSTFLVSTFANATKASDLRLSDALNGLSSRTSHNTNSSKSSNSSATKSTVSENREEKLIEKFNSKCREMGTALDQVERFFAPMARREGAVELRKVANIICSFFEKKAQKAIAMKMYYETDPQNKLQLSSATQEAFSDTPEQYGQHIAMIRSVESVSKEISDYEAQQGAYKAQKDQNEKSVADKSQALAEAQTTLTRLKTEEGQAKADYETVRALLQEAKEDANRCGGQHLLTPAVNTSEETSEPASASVSVEVFDQEMAQNAQDRINLVPTIQVRSNDVKEAGDLWREATKKTGKQEELIESLEEMLKELEKKRDEEEKYQKSLPQKIADLKKKKQALQDKADIYALMKYFGALNIYLACPNDDKSYYGDVKFFLLNPDVLPLTREILNAAAEFAAADFKTYASTALGSKTEEFLKKAIAQSATVYNALNLGYNVADSVIIGRVQELAAKSTDIASTVWKSQEKLLNSFSPVRIKEHDFEDDFNDKYGSMLGQLRADKLVKKSMDKWKKKISTEEGSLVDRLGLKSLLFNPAFQLKAPFDLFSFAKLKQEFPDSPKDSDKTHSAFEKIWHLGVIQMQTSFYSDSGNEPLMTRTDPIYNFSVAKQGESKKEKRIKGDANVEATYATLKYFSYVNMAFGLKYDVEGKESQKIITCPEVYKSLLKEEIPETLRIDNVLAGKAIKWGTRLQQHKEFIKNHALAAYTFAPLNILEEQGEE